MKKDGSHTVKGLFLRYSADVRRFLGARLFQHEDVEDMVQETFLKAHRHANWNKVDNPKAYLVSTARNIFLDRLRSDKRDVTRNAHEISGLEIEDDQPSPEQCAISRNDYQHLCAAIEQLSPRIKQSVILNKFLNLTCAEVARTMNISPRTAEKHIAKGMVECRAYLDRKEKPSSLSNVVALKRNNKT